MSLPWLDQQKNLLRFDLSGDEMTASLNMKLFSLIKLPGSCVIGKFV